MSLYSESLAHIATGLFVLALFHTFSVGWIQKRMVKFSPGTWGYRVGLIVGDVEFVFALWAVVWVVVLALGAGGSTARAFLREQSFAEPIFVGVILLLAASRPSLYFFELCLRWLAPKLRMPSEFAYYLVALILGPLLGSFFTEPGAMTVTAILLRDRYFQREVSPTFRYCTLATLFVNISIGGVLTPYAAPPVVMVAQPWGWDLSFMFWHFGIKAVLAVMLNALTMALIFRKTLVALPRYTPPATPPPPPWLVGLHLLFLLLAILSAHHPTYLVALLILFVGLTRGTTTHQSPLSWKGGVGVACFLAGLVVLGSPQQWWLQPLLPRLTPGTLFLAATGLTAVIDNAALTYLGTQVPHLSSILQYALVAGAVVGGGLTVVANAPNPVGYALLKDSFPEGSISAGRLLISALYPTLIAGLIFWFYPLHL